MLHLVVYLLVDNEMLSDMPRLARLIFLLRKGDIAPAGRSDIPFALFFQRA